MDHIRSHEVLENAKALLRKHGVDPDNLPRGQLYTFASNGSEKQRDSIESYLAQLGLDDESDAVVDEYESQEADDAAALATVHDLLRRCQRLIEELREFKEYLKAKQKSASVEYKNFRDALAAEEKYLTRLATSSPGLEKIQHNIKSSNLPYYEAVWAAAKRSSEISKLRKWFYREKLPQSQALSPGVQQSTSMNTEKLRAMVDVVAESGDLWLKVSTITNQRILFDLAKLGWQNDEMEDDETRDEFRQHDGDDSGVDDEIPLVQTAKDLVKVAKANPIRGHQPRVRFVLPRIFSGRPKDNGAVDHVLEKVRALGVSVVCGQDIPPTPLLANVLPRLLVDHLKGISSTLNIDCTILLALVSDISHQEVDQQPWFPNAVNQQIIVERKTKLLPTWLYPVLAERDLVSTKEAAKRMREIVDTIGTKTEIERTGILLGLGEYASHSQSDLTRAFQHHSNHSIPSQLRLPIRIVDKESAGLFSSLPRLAQLVSTQLTEINRSVFLFGWVSGYATISSNGTVAHQIEKIIEEKRQRGEESVTGPMVWLCTESRSLVAKKGRGDFGKSTVKEIIR